MKDEATIVVKVDMVDALQAISDAAKAIAVNQNLMAAWNASRRLECLAERWNQTTVWHEPPFLHGEIHIETGDLRDIAIIVPFVQGVVKERVFNALNAKLGKGKQ